jgi:cytochrome c556
MKSKNGIALAVAVAATLASTGAFGQAQVIAFRQALMQSNNAALALVFGMISGRVPFDATAAKNALLTIASDNEVFPSYFPEGSNVMPSNALPPVWANKAAFTQLSLKMTADARAAAEAATSAQALMASAAFREVGMNCTTCHTTYRAMPPPR